MQGRCLCVTSVVASVSSATLPRTQGSSARQTLPAQLIASVIRSFTPCMLAPLTSTCGTTQQRRNRPTQLFSIPSSSCRYAILLLLLDFEHALKVRHHASCHLIFVEYTLAFTACSKPNLTAGFISTQIFNQINSRKIKDEYNPFAGLLSSATFLYILLIEVLLQVGVPVHKRMMHSLNV